MKNYLIALALLILVSCSQGETNRVEIKPETLSEIQTFLTSPTLRLINESDSLRLDSVYVEPLSVDSLRLLVVGYEVLNSNLQFVVVAVENFPAKDIPLYTFGGMNVGKFIINSVVVIEEVMLVDISMGEASTFRRMKIEFDLNSQGLFDDWKITEVSTKET